MIARLEPDSTIEGDNRMVQLRQIIDQATRLEDEGDLDGAVNCYEEALLAGFAAPTVCYNLAILYKQQLLYEDALTLLQRCVDSPEYGASTHYAMGECQLALGNLVAASEHFDQAVNRLALDQIPPDQVSEVCQVLQIAIDTFAALEQQDRVDELRATLLSFLADRGLDKPPSGATPAPATEHEATPPPTVSWPDSTADMESSVVEARPASTTGRLRTVYRRATGPLNPNGADIRPQSGTLLNRTRRLPGSGELAQEDTSATGANRYVRRPIAVQGTAPLPGEAALPAEIRLLLSRSAEDFAQGNYNAVLDDCHLVIILAPEYLPIHLRLAETYARIGDIHAAITKCEYLIDLATRRGQETELLPIYALLGAIEPANLQIRITMADLYLATAPEVAPDLTEEVRGLIEEAERQGNDDIALEYAEKLIRHSPDHPVAMRLAARLHLRNGNAHRALAHCQTLLRVNRQDSVAIAGANIALTLIENSIHWPSLETLATQLRESRNGHYRDAMNLYETAIANQDPPRSVNIRIAAALVALACQDYDRALRHFESVEQSRQGLQPATQFALAYGLKQLYAARQNEAGERTWLQYAADMLRDERVRAFVDRTRLFGEPISVGILHVALAENLIRAGKLENAIIVLEAAKADTPQDATINHRLAQLYADVGRLGQALDELDELSTTQLNRGQLAEMIVTLREMSRLAGENLSVKAHLVDRYLKRGCPDQALEELDAIAAIHQRHQRNDDAADALRQAADTAWMIGQQDRAFALYARVIGLAPRNMTLRQSYINCLLQAGRQKEAADQQRAIARSFWEAGQVQETIAALHQVIVLDPRNAESYSLLGEALASVGEYAQAERVYRRLVRLTPDDSVIKAKQTAMAMLAREHRPA